MKKLPVYNSVLITGVYFNICINEKFNIVLYKQYKCNEMPDDIKILTADNKLIHVNYSYEDFIKYSEEEMFQLSLTWDYPVPLSTINKIFNAYKKDTTIFDKSKNFIYHIYIED